MAKKKKMRPAKEQGLPEGFTRAAFTVEKLRLEEFKDAVYWRNMLIKEALDEALKQWIVKQWDEQNGGEAFDPRPEKGGQGTDSDYDKKSKRR